MNLDKYSTNKAARVDVVLKQSAILTVLIPLMALNVLLLAPSRVFPVFGAKNLLRGFRNIIKTYRNHQMSHQMSIGLILLMADIRNFLDKALTLVSNRRAMFLDLPSLAQDSVLHPDSRIIRVQDQSGHHRSVLRRFNQVILLE